VRPLNKILMATRRRGRGFSEIMPSDRGPNGFRVRASLSTDLTVNIFFDSNSDSESIPIRIGFDSQLVTLLCITHPKTNVEMRRVRGFCSCAAFTNCDPVPVSKSPGFFQTLRDIICRSTFEGNQKMWVKMEMGCRKRH